MERLTEYEVVGGHVHAVPTGDVDQAMMRLAAYEDAGLTPSDAHSLWGEWNAMMSVLNSIGGYDRLRKLAKADREGCVIVTGVPPTDDGRDGLRQKYRVYKAKDNMPVDGCFVLRPEKDPAARIALEAYAKATENKVLAEDILAAIGDSGRVVILPCEPGTPVYMTFCGEVWEMRVGQFHVNGYTEPRIWADIDCDWASTRCVRWDLAVGKTVFLTREEAEKALEAMNNG
nr:MAG TPA: hypothetical protein [Caudoviricetes sp.]